MILSVSRRTDIPAFYSDWFFNRIREGFVCVRNPMNIHQVSRIRLSPDVIDCIVFWSKNPRPMLRRLDELKDYMFYFQYTINPYDIRIEQNVPIKSTIIDTFRELSIMLGPDRVIWRYDPIILTNSISIEYHIKYFERIAKRLQGYTNTCVISFLDLYKKTERNLKYTSSRELNQSEMIELANALSSFARQYGMQIQSCAEKIELDSVGIKHGHCIDSVLIEDLLGVKLIVSKDKNQRPECGCVQSIDIGEYNTCRHNCLYCYANYNYKKVKEQSLKHNPDSPLLVGELGPEDKVTDRKIFTFVGDKGLF